MATTMTNFSFISIKLTEWYPFFSFFVYHLLAVVNLEWGNSKCWAVVDECPMVNECGTNSYCQWFKCNLFY